MQTVRATHERCGREVAVDVPDGHDLRIGVRMTCPDCGESFWHRPGASTGGGAPARAAVVGLATTSAVSVEDALLGKLPTPAGQGAGEAPPEPPKQAPPSSEPQPVPTAKDAAATEATAVLAQSGTRTRPPAAGKVGQPNGETVTPDSRAALRARRRARRTRVLKWVAPALILIGVALLLIAFATQRSPLDTEPETEAPPRPEPTQQRTTPRSDAGPQGPLTARVLLRA